MTQKFSNNGRARIGSALTDVATSIVLEAGAGDLFPVATMGTGSIGDYFKVTLEQEDGTMEIVKVRTRVSGSDVLGDVLRAQEGTTAIEFDAGTVIGQRLTVEDISRIFEKIDDFEVFPPGTRSLFAQTAAPTGWTKVTDHNDKALRVVSGAAGAGGSSAFSTTLANGRALAGTVAGTSLTRAQLPSFSQALEAPNSNAQPTSTKVYTGLALNYGTGAYVVQWWQDRVGYNEVTVPSGGSGAAHAHSFTGSLDMGVAYVDVIIASKD